MTIDHTQGVDRDEETTPDPDDDRKPDSPAQIEKRTWLYVVRKVWREFVDDQCTDLAAALTYYGVLAIFPAAIALTAVLGLVADPQRAVQTVLDEIGAHDVPVELVLNKIDRVDALGRRRLANRYPEALQLSAATGEGLPELKARIAELFADRFDEVRLLVPYDDGAALSELYALGAPIDERTDTDEGVLVRARLPRRQRARFARYLIAEDATGRAARGSAP